MIKYLILALYRAIDKKRRLFPDGLRKILKIGKISLTINKLDSGGTYYDSRKSYEEVSSKLYALINMDYTPKVFLDIGANYGFISIIASNEFPNVEIIAVEPSKRLISYLTENFDTNDVRGARVFNSVCGETDKCAVSFSINPSSSQDNRVVGENRKWIKEEVSMLSIDTILKETADDESVCIKIDTQGYEENVFKGAENFLKRNKNWIIKTEFAPYWLKSQGTDPSAFLTRLVKEYDVAELPSTIPFFTESTNELFKNVIEEASVDSFLNHIENLDKKQRGWVDLFIRAKKSGINKGIKPAAENSHQG